MTAIKEFFKSKTFSFLLMLFVTATVLLLIGKLAADLWADIVLYLTGAGTIRGTGEHIPTFSRKKENEILEDLRTKSDDELRDRVLSSTDSGC